MSVTYHRESEQNTRSVLVTQDRQPPSPEAFIRFQRLPGFRLLQKHATVLTTLYRTPWNRPAEDTSAQPCCESGGSHLRRYLNRNATQRQVWFSLRNLWLAQNLHVQGTKGEVRLASVASVANLPDPSTFSIAPCQSLSKKKQKMRILIHLRQPAPGLFWVYSTWEKICWISLTIKKVSLCFFVYWMLVCMLVCSVYGHKKRSTKLQIWIKSTSKWDILCFKIYILKVYNKQFVWTLWGLWCHKCLENLNGLG